jgi:hypothetical protein
MLLNGRQQIFTTTEEINEENILVELTYAVQAHLRNLSEEEYLYWYRRGIQPVLEKKKLVR